jgi:hypothetical protein
MPAITEHIMDKLPHFRIVIDDQNRATFLGHAALLLEQDAEKARQRRSRIVQILNVPQRVRLESSLAAALLNKLFEHPAKLWPTASSI